MCSASFSSVGLSEDSVGACAARAESAWLTVKRARRGKVESRDWKDPRSSFSFVPSFVRAICASICKIPCSSSSCSVIRPVSTAIAPAPPRADRLPRIPVVAFAQRPAPPAPPLSAESPLGGTVQLCELEPLPAPDPELFPLPVPPGPPLPPGPPAPEPGPPGPAGAPPGFTPTPETDELNETPCPDVLGAPLPLPPGVEGSSPLLNQNPPASGASGVPPPPPSPPTMFHVPELPPGAPLPAPLPAPPVP